MAGLLAVALAGCNALTGAHPDRVVVTRATQIQPAPEWKPDGPGVYRAQPVRAPLCRIEGTIEGNIGFELWLPAKWNGRLLGAGVGGDAGVYNYSDMSRRIAEGFATVTTDSGHKQSQARWMADPKARTDYEHRAVHLTAEAAKRLVASFYAKPADHSYFLGCSGGGRQALKEMQLYPGDYDGVVAGAPGPYMPLQSVRMMWFSLQQKWHPEAALSDADWAIYESRATTHCDADDGVRDGIISNPLKCRFNTRVLLCKPGETTQCLSPAKLAMLDAIVAPMTDENGKPMDGGLFPGVRTRPGPPSPLLRAMWADGVYNDANWNEDSFGRTSDLDAANRIIPELRANRLTIDGFIARGGKAILYQGWADPSTNAGPTIDYYAGLADANGGIREIEKNARLFLVPGMYHCGGGPGADGFGGSNHPSWPNDPQRDILWALINWVEKGKAPTRLTATKVSDGQERFTRPLCPFPQSASYDGKGPTGAAASYRCVKDIDLEARMMAKPAG